MKNEKNRAIIHWIKVLLCLALVMSMTGCGQQASEEEKAEKKIQSVAITAARGVIEERFKAEPYNVNWDLDDFTFQGMEEEHYLIEANYRFSVGLNPECVYFDLVAKENLTMCKDADGTWSCLEETDFQIVESSVDAPGYKQITSYDVASHTPFLSRKETEGIDKYNIANKLVGLFAREVAGDGSGEKTSFDTLGATHFRGVMLIDPPENHDEIISFWEIEGGIEGPFIGYIEEYGYAVPFLHKEAELGEHDLLNSRPLYMVEMEEGFYLLSSGEVERRYQK